MRYHPGHTLRDAADILEARIAPHVSEPRTQAELLRVIESLVQLQKTWHLAPEFLKKSNKAMASLLAELTPEQEQILSPYAQSSFHELYETHMQLSTKLAEVVHFLEGSEAEKTIGDAVAQQRALVRSHLRAWLEIETDCTGTDLALRQPD